MVASPSVGRSLGTSILALFLGILPQASRLRGEEPASGSLHNEDVVRMMVAGSPVSTIREAIESRDVDFDLSEEMQDELRLAGIPESLLKAMRARQDNIEKKRAAALAPSPAPALESALRVKLETESPFLLVPDRLSDDQARALQLGSTAGERLVTGAAFFLACRSPEHVPGHWRSASPLGRDFVSMPRHQMLDFRQGGTEIAAGGTPDGIHTFVSDRAEEAGEGGLLRLDVPVELRAELASGTTHDLVVGIAVRVGDRFLAIAQVRKDGVIAGIDIPPLEAEVTSIAGGAGSLPRIRFIEAGRSNPKQTGP